MINTIIFDHGIDILEEENSEHFFHSCILIKKHINPKR